MDRRIKKTKGIGSFFSLTENESKKFKSNTTSFNPTNKIIFYTGRQAIKYVIDSRMIKHKASTIWLPEYYCMHVTEWLKNTYSNIKTYEVNPLDSSFIINASKFTNDNDIVLVNNYWGVSDCNINIEEKNIYIIEDHSHGWLSNSCVNSRADYCVVSLRKSVPVPLGAMAWKPNNEKIDSTTLLSSPESYEHAWNNTFDAMVLKKKYEGNDSKNNLLKEKSMCLVKDAELSLHHNYNLTYIKNNHKTCIENYLAIDFLNFKSNNLNTLKSLLKPIKDFNFVNLDNITFGLIFHTYNKEASEKIKDYLISNLIYPSLLWPNNNPMFGYYFNIHIDFRYGSLEMKYIAEKLNYFNSL